MRPTARAQSALRTPLNAILGTEARVRVLRVLSSIDAPAAPGDLARRTMLQPSGVRLVLRELADTGVVDIVGGGRHRLARLAAQHPLAKALQRLFAAESARVDRIMDGIRAAALTVLPTSASRVWTEGSVATGTDRPGDPVIVGLLGDAATIDSATAALRVALGNVEKDQDVTIEIRSLTRADLATLSPAEREALSDVIPILGIPPGSLVERKATGRNARTHADLDAQALEFGRAIARKLEANPALVASARQGLASRLRRAAASERGALKEWDRILATISIPRLRRLLVDPGPRATRLRQSLPFLDALSPRERDEILRSAQRKDR